MHECAAATRRRAWSKSGTPIKPDDKREIEGWDAPFDDVSRNQPAVCGWRSASRGTSRLWQQQGRRPGDMLILVRQRGALFEAIIRALEERRHRRSPAPTGWC